ncbi:hypothetical protein SAMN04488546_2193 [Geodermatophilus poikilotrophus]|uniref:Short C-terminal domain-containing protein n=1 Tax=Geodermatophilus poikilotrophus TaxID=1333667 RepID=A0A1I0DXX0_9ACTN|nr:hypothetical protein SAMN04488546_2193 [Geodermatophilus poikilotrophus]
MVDTNTKDKELTRLLPQIGAHLVTGEDPVLVMKGASMRPMTDVLVVTNARVVAFSSLKWADGAKFEARAGQIESAEADGRKVAIRTREGEAISFSVGKAEASRAVDAISRLASGAPDARVDAGLDAARAASDANEAAWDAVPIAGSATRNRVNRATWRVLRAAAYEDEVPLFLITGDDGTGVLAAFTDRCMIIKAGLMTSALAGSFGGSRQATFHYSQITGIEYNAGLLLGVLEILTASYNGTANKDRWRGISASRNKDANQAEALSNTLPLAKDGYKNAQGHINELRRLVSASKQVQVMVESPTPSDGGGNLASELGKLAELKQQGLLDDAEFAEAKRAVLAKFS